VSPGFTDFVLDQLRAVGEVVPRRMFGGVGLYCDGLFFAIIAADVLYLKVDDATRARVVAAGARPFKPYPERGTTMQYYSVPPGVLESPIELARWARDAVAAAARKAAAGS
jgi:DNA transformation protein